MIKIDADKLVERIASTVRWLEEHREDFDIMDDPKGFFGGRCDFLHLCDLRENNGGIIATVFDGIQFEKGNGIVIWTESEPYMPASLCFRDGQLFRREDETPLGDKTSEDLLAFVKKRFSRNTPPRLKINNAPELP